MKKSFLILIVLSVFSFLHAEIDSVTELDKNSTYKYFVFK